MLVKKYRILYFTELVFFLCSVNSFCSDLKDTKNQVDYILIAPTSYYSMAQTLADFRHTKNGYATTIINIDTIYAQFGSGATQDTTLKNFIQYAANSWSNPKPQYFVLVGNTNVIPSHPEVETLYYDDPGCDSILMIDQWFVEKNDSSNYYPTINACIARLPAWDSLGLSVMISKTIEYENDTTSAWTNRVISLADYWAADYGYQFESDAQNLRSLCSPVWSDTVAVDIRSDSPNHIDTAAFINLWNNGAAIVSYNGHACQEYFSHYRYFTTEDVDSLHNGNRLPVCLFGGCDLTYDTRPPVSLPTHLLQKSGGGAVAVIASEGLSYEGASQDLYSFMITALTKNITQSLGAAFIQAKATINDFYYEEIKRFTLLGDPALIIKHPANVTSIASTHSQPATFALNQNYPNPFNPTTTITYNLPSTGWVTLKVYDVLGREVKKLVDDRQTSGSHSIMFNANRLASGTYFYRLQAGSFVQTKKLVLLK